MFFIVPALLPLLQNPTPAPQNPSPMVDHTRRHDRISQSQPAGTVTNLSLGTLFISDAAGRAKSAPLVIHLLGPAWLADTSATRWRKAVVVLNISVGAGSRVFEEAFREPNRFAGLLREAKGASGLDLSPTIISSFSAGYGAVRAILRNQNNWPMIDGIILEDSLHTSYVPEGKPGPLDPGPLQMFVDFARAATEGKKRMAVTHSEIFPGTFASTTETTDYLLSQLGLKRTPVLKWGPGGMQQLSDVRVGQFHLMGFAGNTAPDHVDHLYGLSRWLKDLYP